MRANAYEQRPTTLYTVPYNTTRPKSIQTKPVYPYRILESVNNRACSSRRAHPLYSLDQLVGTVRENILQ